MNPMTGLTLSRAKAGMTIPAAPRIVSASLRPVPPAVISPSIPALEQARANLSPLGVSLVEVDHGKTTQERRPSQLAFPRWRGARQGRQEGDVANDHQGSQGGRVKGQSGISRRNRRGQTGGPRGGSAHEGLRRLFQSKLPSVTINAAMTSLPAIAGGNAKWPD